MPSLLLSICAGLPLLAAGPGQQAAGAQPFGPREAEHLLNRAAFGATPAEVARAVALGREAVVEELLKGGAGRGEFFFERLVGRPESMEEGAPLDREALKAERREQHKEDEEQLADFAGFWTSRMVSGDDPLREKLTLFWHGHFATSQKTVRDSYEMIRQNQLFYAHALGSFKDLLHGAVRDPALLSYLDNDENKKGQPNENLARELMELFTLGPGNYTEGDVKEAARALTGWSEVEGRFRVVPRRHDDGTKTILGATGAFDGDDLADLLLAQKACGPFVAGELIAWFEGVEPSDKRRAEYGRFFAQSGYDVTALLRRLFNDPAFYRPEIVGNRVASPVECVVGLVRRLELEPPPRLLPLCTGLLGQQLFHPPSVKGWDEEEAWITTSSLMLRSNVAGILLGVVSMDDVAASGGTPEMQPQMQPEPEMDGPAMDPAMDGEPQMEVAPARRLGELQLLKAARGFKWHPRYSLAQRFQRAGLRSDGSLADALCAEFLAVEASPETRAFLTGELAARRGAAGLAEAELFSEPEVAERVLRETAHVVLSLPEAQLN
jgi:hypothetical protein